MIIGVPKESAPGERRVALVPSVVKRLTDCGARILVESGAGLYAGCPNAQYIEAGANIEAQDTIDGGTPLIHASRTGSAVGMKSLLDSGASIEARDRNGKTALLAAAGHSGGTTEKLILLMDSGSDLTATDNAGRNALVLAQARTDDDASAVIALLKERMPEGE